METEVGGALRWAGFCTTEIENRHYFQDKAAQIILLVTHGEYHLTLNGDLGLFRCLLNPAHPWSTLDLHQCTREQSLAMRNQRDTARGEMYRHIFQFSLWGFFKTLLEFHNSLRAQCPGTDQMIS